MTHEVDNQSTADEDLERWISWLFRLFVNQFSFSALQLSRETMEQIIDEFEITKRESLNEPIGLKNIGNTCWFNSIVQTLYTLPFFRELILNFQLIAINRPLTASVNNREIVSFCLITYFEFNLGTTSYWFYWRTTKSLYFNVKITSSIN